MLWDQRQRQLAAREADGESLWTSWFSDEAVNRITAQWEVGFGWKLFEEAAQEAFQRVLVGLGKDFSGRHRAPNNRSLLAMIMKDNECTPSLIEAFLNAAAALSGDDLLMKNEVSKVNRVLAEERISFEYIDGQIVDFESKELHDAVVAPTLRLLSGRTGWEAVERAYQDALREIGENPPDAITDAGTALQEALKVAGAEGNALGSLVTSARKRGLLGAHDSPLTEGLTKLIHWVEADRSTKGDAHNADPANRADAWLAVHVTGALILRLADATPR